MHLSKLDLKVWDYEGVVQYLPELSRQLAELALAQDLCYQKILPCPTFEACGKVRHSAGSDGQYKCLQKVLADLQLANFIPDPFFEKAQASNRRMWRNNWQTKISQRDELTRTSIYHWHRVKCLASLRSPLQNHILCHRGWSPPPALCQCLSALKASQKADRRESLDLRRRLHVPLMEDTGRIRRLFVFWPVYDSSQAGDELHLVILLTLVNHYRIPTRTCSLMQVSMLSLIHWCLQCLLNQQQSRLRSSRFWVITYIEFNEY